MGRRAPAIVRVVGWVLVGWGALVIGFNLCWALLFEPAKLSSGSTTCRSYLKQLGTAMAMYAGDNDDRLPLASNWEDGMYSYYRNPAVTVCPKDRAGRESYAYNAALHSRNMKALLNPAAAPALFDSSLHIHNGSDLLESWAPRHKSDGPRGNVCFADGHAKLLAVPPPARAGIAPGK